MVTPIDKFRVPINFVILKSNGSVDKFQVQFYHDSCGCIFLFSEKNPIQNKSKHVKIETGRIDTRWSGNNWSVIGWLII